MLMSQQRRIEHVARLGISRGVTMSRIGALDRRSDGHAEEKIMRRMYGIGLSLVVLLTVGCGGKDKNEAKDASDETKTEREPTEEEINEMLAETGLQFDEEAAAIVLKRGARKVSDCAKEGAATGEGEITAVFDGPKGRIVDVELGYTFEDGSPRGQSCIKNAFIGEIIPPFEGTKKMPVTITITEGGAAPKDGDNK
jgi:hypothetical protein